MIFSTIPTTTRTPGSYGEFDASGARPGASTKPRHILLFAHKLSGGTASANVPVRVTGGAPQCDTLGGIGSPISEMGRVIFDVWPDAEVTVIHTAEPSGGAAAAGTLVWTGTATADGTISLYVAGRLLEVDVLSGDTHTAIATAVFNAINADTRMPISATNGTAGTTTLAAKWKGTSGNDILVELNRLTSQSLPAGISCTVTTMASGSGVPQAAATIAAIPDDNYDRIVTQFNDDTTMDLLEAEARTRWGAMVQLDTIVHAGWRGTYADAATYGAARNCELSTVVCIEKSPTAPWIAAANYAAVAATETDPARPLNTLALAHVVAPKVSERYTRTERDELLHTGMTTCKVDAADVVRIERAITTYQTNASSLDDDTYLDITTPQTLSYMRWDVNRIAATKYPRHKLADDDTRTSPDQPVITPTIWRGEILALGEAWERAGLLEDFNTFRESVTVERNGSDPNRLDTFLPPNLVNGAHVFASKYGFIL